MNYLIMEAVMLKVNREDEDARKSAEREAEIKRKKEEAKAKLKQYA